jgi:hypothetical protein
MCTYLHPYLTAFLKTKQSDVQLRHHVVCVCVCVCVLYFTF